MFIHAQSNIESDMKWTLTDNKDIQTVQHIPIHSEVQVERHTSEPFQYLTQTLRQEKRSVLLI